MKIAKAKVLLLNNTYEPIGIIPVKNVLRKILKGSSSFYVDSYYQEPYMHGEIEIKIPAVVRLTYYIRPKKSTRKVNGRKRDIFKRDSYTCVYCGFAGDDKELTLDHVVPRSRGGDNTSYNLVTACFPCNNKKGDKLPEELGIKVNKSLLASNLNLSAMMSAARTVPEWRQYLYIE